MATQMIVRRMKRELQLLSKSTAPGISAWPREDGNRIDVIDAEIIGACDTPYADGIFRLEIHIPPEYPLKPPRVKFNTPIYHPNIDSQGRICLDSLNMPPKGAWKPSLNISTLLTTIQALMSTPNPDDGLMVEITDEYRRNPALFNKKARDSTLQHAVASSVTTPGHNDDEIEKTMITPQATVVIGDGKRTFQQSAENSNQVEKDKRSSPCLEKGESKDYVVDGDFEDGDDNTYLHSRLKKKPRR